MHSQALDLMDINALDTAYLCLQPRAFVGEGG